MMTGLLLSLGQSLATAPITVNAMPADAGVINTVEDLSGIQGNLVGDGSGGGRGNANPYSKLLEAARGDPV